MGLVKPGAVLAGRYAIERVIGRGAMAVVYEATHVKLKRKVAVKMLLPSLAENTEVAHRFAREARALEQLHGPNITEVLDVDTGEDGVPFIVMEFLDGQDLAKEMKNRADLPIEEAVGYILQAASAMTEAHALGIVHRDLKPANLFLCGPPGARVVKVLDFGISKVMSGETGLTATSVVLGTPVYMAPEQIEFAKSVDARADIWSLGVILYELLACDLPFRGGNATAVISSVMRDPPKPLKDRRPDAPDALVLAIEKALAKEPDERFPTVAAFAEALSPFGPKGAFAAAAPVAVAETADAEVPSLSKIRRAEEALAKNAPVKHADAGRSTSPTPTSEDALPDRPTPQRRGSNMLWLFALIAVFGAAALVYWMRGGF